MGYPPSFRGPPEMHRVIIIGTCDSGDQTGISQPQNVFISLTERCFFFKFLSLEESFNDSIVLYFKIAKST